MKSLVHVATGFRIPEHGAVMGFRSDRRRIFWRGYGWFAYQEKGPNRWELEDILRPPRQPHPQDGDSDLCEQWARDIRAYEQTYGLWCAAEGFYAASIVVMSHAIRFFSSGPEQFPPAELRAEFAEIFRFDLCNYGCPLVFALAGHWALSLEKLALSLYQRHGETCGDDESLEAWIAKRYGAAGATLIPRLLAWEPDPEAATRQQAWLTDRCAKRDAAMADCRPAKA